MFASAESQTPLSISSALRHLSTIVTRAGRGGGGLAVYLEAVREQTDVDA